MEIENEEKWFARINEDLTIGQSIKGCLFFKACYYKKNQNPSTMVSEFTPLPPPPKPEPTSEKKKKIRSSNKHKSEQLLLAYWTRAIAVLATPNCPQHIISFNSLSSDPSSSMQFVAYFRIFDDIKDIIILRMNRWTQGLEDEEETHFLASLSSHKLVLFRYNLQTNSLETSHIFNYQNTIINTLLSEAGKPHPKPLPTTDCRGFQEFLRKDIMFRCFLYVPQPTIMAFCFFTLYDREKLLDPTRASLSHDTKDDSGQYKRLVSYERDNTSCHRQGDPFFTRTIYVSLEESNVSQIIDAAIILSPQKKDILVGVICKQLVPYESVAIRLIYLEKIRDFQYMQLETRCNNDRLIKEPGLFGTVYNEVPQSAKKLLALKCGGILVISAHSILYIKEKSSMLGICSKNDPKKGELRPDLYKVEEIPDPSIVLNFTMNSFDAKYVLHSESQWDEVLIAHDKLYCLTLHYNIGKSGELKTYFVEKITVQIVNTFMATPLPLITWVSWTNTGSGLANLQLLVGSPFSDLVLCRMITKEAQSEVIAEFGNIHEHSLTVLDKLEGGVTKRSSLVFPRDSRFQAAWVVQQSGFTSRNNTIIFQKKVPSLRFNNHNKEGVLKLLAPAEQSLEEQVSRKGVKSLNFVPAPRKFFFILTEKELFPYKSTQKGLEPTSEPDVKGMNVPPFCSEEITLTVKKSFFRVEETDDLQPGYIQVSPSKVRVCLETTKRKETNPAFCFEDFLLDEQIIDSETKIKNHRYLFIHRPSDNTLKVRNSIKPFLGLLTFMNGGLLG